MQIIVAWAEQTKLVPTGNQVNRDKNLFPEMRLDWEGKAAMWLRSGTKTDLAKAEAFARREGHAVYTFPKSERDALAKARNMAIEDARRTA